jgi:hypothetical protein
MSYDEVFGNCTVAISISESSDMLALGLSDEHLIDAMTEIARHLLALGARLVYGGDLRAKGFSKLLFELVARHRRDADFEDKHPGVINYLAWPVHIRMPFAELEQAHADLLDTAELICLGLDGSRLSMEARQHLQQEEPSDKIWIEGLTAMRRVMLEETTARVVLGGSVDQYKGIMPGIAEETLLSLQAHQPLFVIGGFGGCVRDIAEMIGLLKPRATNEANWKGRDAFQRYTAADLNNGLTAEDNSTLARTPHVDQAVTLILRGLMNSITAVNNVRICREENHYE